MKMAKKSKHGRNAIVSVLLAALLASSVTGSFTAFADTPEEVEKNIKNSTTLNSLAATAEIMTSTTYSEYLAKLDNPEKGEDSLVINAVDYDEEKTTAAVQVLEDYDGDIGGSLLTPDTGKVVWNFEIKTPGLYSISTDYYPYPGNSASIERVLFVDGRVPFKEARYLTFSRIWKEDYEAEGFIVPEKLYKVGTDIDSSNADSNAKAVNEELEDGKKNFREEGRYFKYDYYQNEIRPTKVEKPEWVTKFFTDADTFHDAPFEFYFEAGEHTITLDGSREPLLLKSISIAPLEKVKTYEEIKAEYEKNGYKSPSTSNIVKMDAEVPAATSEQVVYPLNDRTSPITEPQHSSAIRLNSIGGSTWQLAGQWVTYEFEVEEDGLYYIIPRYMQNVNAGLFSSRKIYINGEEPFVEARNIRFDYSDDWQTKPLGSDTEDFMFYFEKGKKYELKLEAVLGDMGDILLQIDESLSRMNEYYRKIIMITGTQPDAYLDYDFASLIPDVLRGMRQESALLTEISSNLEALIGEKGDQSVILDKIAYLLDIMGNDETKVAANLANYKSYIGSLGTWILTARSQPLALDYIVVVPTDSDFRPRATGNFFQNIKHEFTAFINSFFANYNSVGATEDLEGKEGVLEVWITTGRDQAQIIRQMVTEYTKLADTTDDEYPAVNIKLIAAGTLLPATLAGMGPDVSMDGDPVSYGVRNAVLNLNDRNLHEGKDLDGNPLPEGTRPYISLEELNEVRSWFSDAAFVPVTVYNPDYIPQGDELDEKYSQAIYGLPETQNFSMMFYRKDIFVDLGLEVPETWDELYDIIRIFSENNMEMGLSIGLHSIMMYQQDEPWYKGDDVASIGMATNLDSDVSLDVFKTVCDLFTQYQQPYTYDAANRFRTGEMPILIADYTLYNQLTVFAPEIKGLWEFVQLPGTRRTAINDETGEEYTYIDHTASSSVGAKMIMKDTDMPRAAWNYLRWWISAPTQSRFGNEQVAIIGTAAKYATANIEALQSQSWSSNEKRNLTQQFDSLQGTPMTPGNYIVARNQNFAFLSVYNDGATPADAMQSYIPEINKEITRKRDEYDFRTLEETLEEYRAEQEERLGVELEYLGELARKEAEAKAAEEAAEAEALENIK